MISRLFLSATNHVLAQSGWARQRLMPHAGRTAHLDVTPLDLNFSVANDGYLAEWQGQESQPDVRLSLPAGEIPQMLTEGSSTLMRHVRIEGNAEFADALGFVFRNLRWDVEEDLSRIIGDILAHRAVSTGKALATAQRQALLNTADNLAEYLTEEKPVLVRREALAAFSREIIELRDAVGRTEKRIARLSVTR